MEVTQTAPSVEMYRDYRQFLTDFYRFKKSLRSGFSFRLFAQKSGFKSPNYLQLVMKGERNLSEDMAERVAKAMNLTFDQTHYFISLVHQENAKTDDQLRSAQEASLIALKKLVSKPLESGLEKILSDWYFVVIRELASLPDFKPCGEFISRKLKGLITPQQAETSLKVLLDSGFLRIENNKCFVVNPVLDSGDEISSSQLIKNYHSRNLQLWSQNLDKWKTRELEMGILTLSLPASKIPELKQKIRNFQDQILGWLQDESNPDTVVQLGLYMFPLAESESKKTNP